MKIKMDQKERVKLIRLGNEKFNSGDMKNALAIFIKTGYRDGIARVADYLYYEKKQPLAALKYYMMIKRDDRIEEIFARMAFAFGKLLGRESPGPRTAKIAGNSAVRVELPPLKVSPKLKILAEEILRDQKEKNGQ